ncbi:MAG: sigma-70 family RNA polymerase sigma factor [Bacteroidaceae bacterium]|nr:sigma-70 family RNA polymerase sigma factor [Bacteroidaceae bacterium]
MTNLSMLTDDELVMLYQNNNNSAFDELLGRYKDKLYTYIYFNVHDEDTANDVFQETFVRVIMTIQQGRYTATGKFYSWLMRIARNQIIDLFRVQKNENTVSNDDVDVDLFNNIQLADMPVENQMISEQTLVDVHRLMEHLPDNQREIVVMRYFQNLSFKEIAEATGVGINTALGRMRYAILNMRRMAEEHQIALTL